MRTENDTQTWLTKDVHKRLRMAAMAFNKTTKEMLEEMINDWIKRHEKEIKNAVV
jgi:predicted transcriptional regulator